MMIVARYRAWVAAHLARDARRGAGTLFVRVWLSAGLLWGVSMSLWRLFLAPRQGLAPTTLGEVMVLYLGVGLLFFGPLMALFRLSQVAHWRQQQAGPKAAP